MRTNYRLKDGDTVRLLQPARVDGYWHDDIHAPRGSWDSHYMLPGAVGVVVRARTPCVWTQDGKQAYFANVDIAHNGVVSRVRVGHEAIRRIRGGCGDATGHG